MCKRDCGLGYFAVCKIQRERESGRPSGVPKGGACVQGKSTLRGNT